MSEQTKQAIDDAIAAHIRDEVSVESFVTGYVITIASMTPQNLEDGVMNYRNVYYEGQPFHASVGLVELAQQRLAHHFAN